MKTSRAVCDVGGGGARVRLLLLLAARSETYFFPPTTISRLLTQKAGELPELAVRRSPFCYL